MAANESKFPDEREPIVDKCSGLLEGKPATCRKAKDNYCTAFISPAAKWRNGDCPLADEFLRTKTAAKTKEKTRLGQQKQKK